jgi:hypothetical protein
MHGLPDILLRYLGRQVTITTFDISRLGEVAEVNGDHVGMVNTLVCKT